MKSLFVPPCAHLSTLAVASMLGVSMLAAGGCGVAPSGNDGSRDDVVAVQPRVVLDGLIELSQRTEGRLFVDEVVFHAPAVDLMNGRHELADVLASDPDGAGPLFFRYDVAAPEGYGHVLGGERQWRLVASGAVADPDLVFGFSPLTASRRAMDDLSAEAGYRLDALNGHTAFVHGFVAVDEAAQGFTASSARGNSSSGDRSSGDPDGAPAQPKNPNASGDPDGAPADQGGETSSGDPDGAPADQGGENGNGESSSGDPDGAPADTTGKDGDGQSGDGQSGDGQSGDPDGSPAQGDAAQTAAGHDEPIHRHGSVSQQGRRSKLVPFYIVLDSGFDLRVPLRSLPEARPGEILPIDLHLQADNLFDVERVGAIDRTAAADTTTAVVLELDASETSSVFGIAAQGEAIRRQSTKAQPKIIIEGDPRGH